MSRTNFQPKEIFRTVRAVIEKFTRDIEDPELVIPYQNGSKDAEIRDRTQPLLGSIRNALVDQNALLSTPSENYTTIRQGVNFLSDMMNELVLTVIDVVNVREQDINSEDGTLNSAEINELFDSIKGHMEALLDVPTVDPLREELSFRSNFYTAKPFLRERISDLVFERGGYYVLEPSKALNHYSNGDVIGRLVDPNGQPVDAQARVAQIPAGMTLDTSTGIISVSDANALELGIHVFNVETISTAGETGTGKQTTHLVTVQLAEDLEIDYVVNPPQRLSSVAVDDILAIPADLGIVQSAELLGGTLPSGVKLDESTGEIAVKNTKLLQAGIYNIVVGITNTLGKQSQHNLALTIERDLGLFYYVEAPSETYENGQLLAELSDNSDLISASVSQIPPGMEIDSVTGQLTVADASALVPGQYFVSVITTNVQGNEVTSSINITVGDPAGPALSYYVEPAEDVEDYQNGSVLAYVVGPETGSFEGLAGAVFRSGALPPGTNLNRTSGAIRVTNANNLQAGQFTAQITLTDLEGNITETSVTIGIGSEPVYVVNVARNIKSYAADEEIAAPIIPLGTLTNAAITSGTLPSGVSLDAATGILSVSDTAALAGGSTELEVTLTVDNGSSVDFPLEVTIEFLADNEAVYTVNTAKRLGEYTANEVLATVVDEDGPIVSASVTAGGLPPGVALDPVDGTIRVSNLANLGPGTFTGIRILTEDVAGGTTEQTIALTILPQTYFYYTLAAVKNVNDYTDGEALATLVSSETGALQTVSIAAGQLPPGAAFDGATGDITVGTAAELAPGSYPLTLQTTDTNGATSTLEISLTLLGQGQTAPIPEGASPLLIPAWDNFKAYIQNEVTRYGSDLYVSLTNSNSGNQPDSSPSDWVVISQQAAVPGINDVLAVDNDVAYPQAIAFSGNFFVGFNDTDGFGLHAPDDDDIVLTAGGNGEVVIKRQGLTVEDQKATFRQGIDLYGPITWWDSPNKLSLVFPTLATDIIQNMPSQAGTLALTSDITTAVGNLGINDVLAVDNQIADGTTVGLGSANSLLVTNSMAKISGQEFMIENSDTIFYVGSDQVVIQSTLEVTETADFLEQVKFASIEIQGSATIRRVTLEGTIGSPEFTQTLQDANGTIALTSDISAAVGNVGINDVLANGSTISQDFSVDSDLQIALGGDLSLLTSDDGISIEGSGDILINTDSVVALTGATGMDIAGPLQIDDTLDCNGDAFFAANTSFGNANFRGVAQGNQVSINASAVTGSFTQTLQAKSGTIALLSDISGGGAGIDDVLAVNNLVSAQEMHFDEEVALQFGDHVLNWKSDGFYIEGAQDMTIDLDGHLLMIANASSLEVEGDFRVQSGAVFENNVTAQTGVTVGTIAEHALLLPPTGGQYNLTLPAATGTVALLSDITSQVGGLDINTILGNNPVIDTAFEVDEDTTVTFGADFEITYQSGELLIENGTKITVENAEFEVDKRLHLGLDIRWNQLVLNSNANGPQSRTQTFQDADGTVALTDDITNAIGAIDADDVAETAARKWLTQAERDDISSNSAAQGQLKTDSSDSNPDYLPQKVDTTSDVSVEVETGGRFRFNVDALQGVSLDAPATKGDILVYDGTDYSYIPAGDDGAVLHADSTSSTGWRAVVPAYASFRIQGGAFTYDGYSGFLSIAETGTGALVPGQIQRVLEILNEDGVPTISNPSDRSCWVEIHLTGDFEHDPSGTYDTEIKFVCTVGSGKDSHTMFYPISSIKRAIGFHVHELEMPAHSKYALYFQNFEQPDKTLLYDLSVSVRDIQY